MSARTEQDPQDELDGKPNYGALTEFEVKWLERGLASGATRVTAAAAAGIPDLDALIEVLPDLALLVSQTEARAEVRLLEGMGESRPAFVLERTRPDKYGPSATRPLKAPDDPNDDLFGDKD
jgi:hypothetical protein